MSKTAKLICVVLLLACVALWFLAPYIRLFEDITAFEMVKATGKAGTLFKVETAEDVIALCAVLGTVVGVVICLITSLAGSRALTGIVGIITEIPLVFGLVKTHSNLAKYYESDVMKRLFEYYGVGYWGIILLVLVVIIVALAGKKKA